jgi:hypothetical protein
LRAGAAFSSGARASGSARNLRVDRQLARRNLRTALIASMIALVIFAASFVVGLIY